MLSCKFLHTGMTVTDFDRTVDFYTTYFGFVKTLDSRFDAEFLQTYRTLYRLPEGTCCRFGFLKAPDETVIELFQFTHQLPPQTARWDQPGYHHICLEVPDIRGLCTQMQADGISFFFVPEKRGRDGEKYWVFLQDPDGNMIELQQN